MAFEDEYPIVDLDIEGLPVVDLDVPAGKPRPKPKPKKKLPIQPIKPPALPPGVTLEGITSYLTGEETPEVKRRRQVVEATKAFEATQLPEPHKFVPKVKPLAKFRDLGAEEAQFEQTLRDAERRIAKEKMEATRQARTAPGFGTQLSNRFMRGYAGSLKSTLKGMTLLNPQAATDLTTKFLYQTPQEERAQWQGLLPVNEYDRSFTMRAAESIGSSVPYLMGGAAGSAAGLPGWMMSSVLGAASNAGSTYDDAIAKGADENTARYSAVIGALIGLGEGLGIGRMGIPEANTAAFATPLMKRMLGLGMHLGKEGIEEWAQEYGSQVLNNVNAKVIGGYDPKRAIQEGVWEAGSMGFLTGGILAGGMRGVTGLTNAMDPEYRAARREHMQAQLVDKAFRKFLGEEKVRDDFAKAHGMPARVPPPPGYTRGIPEGTTLKPTSMRPGWDMGLMSEEPIAPKKSFGEEMDEFVSSVDQQLLRDFPNEPQPSVGGQRPVFSTYSQAEVNAMTPEEYDWRLELATVGQDSSFAEAKMRRILIARGSDYDDARAAIKEALNSSTPLETLKVLAPDDQEFADLAETYFIGQDRIKLLDEHLAPFNELKRQQAMRAGPTEEELLEEEYASREREELERLKNQPLASEEEYPKGWGPEPNVYTEPPEGDPLAFDVMPALRAGQAPYLRMPKWALTAIRRESTRGFNVNIEGLDELIYMVSAAAPSKEHADIAVKALMDLAEQSKTEGVDTLSLVRNDADEEYVRGVIEHEVTHAATRMVPPTDEWINGHPLLDDVLNRTPYPGDMAGITVKDMKFPWLRDFGGLGAAHQPLAMEILSHYVQNRLDQLGMTEDEGRQFFKDYLNHIRSTRGQEAVDRFRNVTRVRQAVVEVIDESDREWQEWEIAGYAGPLDLSDIVPGDMVLASDDPTGEPQEVTEVVGDVVTTKTRAGSINTLKAKLRKAVNWINTAVGRRSIEENPPTPPTIPPDVPPPQTPKPPPPPPPPPPRGGPPQGPEEPRHPIFKEHISPEHNQLLTRTFLRMLREGGVEVNPIDAPFQQVYKALIDGKLMHIDIEEIMTNEGINIEEIADLMEMTASDAGKVLQSYSEIARFWNQIIDEWEISEGGERPRGGATGPKLPGEPKELLKLVPPSYRVRKALRGVRTTALGKSWWQRSGNATQKAMLTQLSTFMVNSMTAGGQLPIRIATQGLGAWMYQMGEGKGNFARRLHNANVDTLDAMRAGLEVLFAFNPRQIADIMTKRGGRRAGREFARYQAVVHQLERVFPDLHKKLFALSSGTETLKKGQRELSMAKALVTHVKHAKTREKFLLDMEKYETRLKQNVSGLGAIFNGVEMVYDFHLQPMQFAEYFLRRPMFVGQLTLELKRQGIDLQTVLARNALDLIPRETVERAVNRALEFTYAYMPGTDTGTNYAMEQFVENAAARAIEWTSRFGGPLNALIGEPFLKAAYNGAKFVYEYSPVGGILPFGRIMKNLSPEFKKTITDPVTKRKIVVNPTNQEDYDRLAKAMVGSLMYASIYFLKQAIGGDEWWQLDLGEKDEKGRKVYTDIRRYKPMSTMFQVVDLVERIRDGRMGDVSAPQAAVEILTGIRMFDNQMGGNIIESTADWFRNEDPQSAGLKAKEDVGKAMAVYITPLLNLRDCIAQFVEEENIKKDTRGEGIMGPIIDRIPFLRQRLPNLTSPVEPLPIKLSFNPMGAQFGYKEVPAEDFSGREWRRLGLYNRSFLERDPDPIINRAQNERFQEMVKDLGETFEGNPIYTRADDKGKAMLWETAIAGDKGLAAAAREMGAMANPDAAIKRALLQQSGMGRFMKAYTGFEEEVKKMFPEK